MEYNTSRSKMSISEYGRNIQKMIEYIMTIEDRDKRNQLTTATINVMGQLNPHLRDVNDFKHKLWDHLFIMSDFKLDVDSPYPTPSPQTLARKPERLRYSTNNVSFKHYGRHIELIIEEACKLENGDEKTALVNLIANHLKKSYLTWNRDTVTDEEIASHLILLSGGRLRLSDNVKLSNVVEPPPKPKKKKYQGKPGNGKPYSHKNKKGH